MSAIFVTLMGICLGKIGMDNDKKIKIAELAEIAFEKAEKLRLLGMINIPSDYEDRKQQAIDYAIAKYEMIHSYGLLQKEINND